MDKIIVLYTVKAALVVKQLLIILNIPILAATFLQIWSAWLFHVKCLSKTTPKYLNLDSALMFWSRNLKFKSLSLSQLRREL